MEGDPGLDYAALCQSYKLLLFILWKIHVLGVPLKLGERA